MPPGFSTSPSRRRRTTSASPGSSICFIWEALWWIDLQTSGGRTISQFGPYEIVGECGRGGMSVVYSAVHASLRTRHAVKVFDVGNCANAGVLGGKFLAEARVLATLRHPNIVRVTDHGTTGVPPLHTHTPGWSWTLSKGRRLPPAWQSLSRRRTMKRVHFTPTSVLRLHIAIRAESCMAT